MVESRLSSMIFFFKRWSLLLWIFQSSRFVLTMLFSLRAASSFSFREIPSLASNYLTLWLCLERVQLSMVCALLVSWRLFSSAVRFMLFFSKFLLIVIGKTYPRYFCRRTASVGCIHSWFIHPRNAYRSARVYPSGPAVLPPRSWPSAEPSLLMIMRRKRLRKGIEGFMSSFRSNCDCNSWKRVWLSLAIERKRWVLPERDFT